MNPGRAAEGPDEGPPSITPRPSPNTKFSRAKHQIQPRPQTPTSKLLPQIFKKRMTPQKYFACWSKALASFLPPRSMKPYNSLLYIPYHPTQLLNMYIKAPWGKNMELQSLCHRG